MSERDFNQFTEIKTDRLILRGLQLSDDVQMAAIRSNEEVNKYIDRTPCLSVAEAKAFIRQIQRSVAKGDSYYWAICYQEDNKLTGTICLWNIDTGKAQADLGYELLPDAQGKGIMAEALKNVIGFAFDRLQFKKLIAITHRNNANSVSLLKKFGFADDELPEGENNLGPDEICFALNNS